MCFAPFVFFFFFFFFFILCAFFPSFLAAWLSLASVAILVRVCDFQAGGVALALHRVISRHPDLYTKPRDPRLSAQSRDAALPSKPSSSAADTTMESVTDGSEATVSDCQEHEDEMNDNDDEYVVYTGTAMKTVSFDTDLAPDTDRGTVSVASRFFGDVDNVANQIGRGNDDEISIDNLTGGGGLQKVESSLDENDNKHSRDRSTSP